MARRGIGQEVMGFSSNRTAARVTNARASVTELSQKLKVSRGTVQNRIVNLLGQGIIRRFTVELGDSEDDHQISAFRRLPTAHRTSDGSV